MHICSVQCGRQSFVLESICLCINALDSNVAAVDTFRAHPVLASLII